MKKMVSLAVFFAIVFAGVKVMAQQKDVTSAMATKEKGYTVLNAGQPIVIYKYQHASHSPKEIERYVPKYFFTTSSSNVLQELTKTNLKKAFPNAHPFHDALDANFKEDKELIAYDIFHKVYKIDRLYTTTVKN
ncbi:MAG: hypothetical protein J0H74_32810 [Chitinophagaceae bacterium]|nr:hypothetical protein [Chitinophagaceae bacterium]